MAFCCFVQPSSGALFYGKDAKHYGEWVNSQMLQWMKNDEYRITEENLAEYEKNADDLIKSYDYDQLFK